MPDLLTMLADLLAKYNKPHLSIMRPLVLTLYDAGSGHLRIGNSILCEWEDTKQGAAKIAGIYQAKGEENANPTTDGDQTL